MINIIVNFEVPEYHFISFILRVEIKEEPGRQKNIRNCQFRLMFR